ncbi:hypothetical protein HDV01_003700, partial [Terramyces sp. JEL0728]
MQRIKWYDEIPPDPSEEQLEFVKWKEHCQPTDTWSTVPFRYNKDGPLIIPPRLPFKSHSEEYSSSDFDSSDNEKPEFTSDKRKKLRSLICGLKNRKTINRAMCFCIRYGNSASEVIDILVSSIMVVQDYDQRQLRIYLLNDILYNSKSRYPDAWKYRSVIENTLKELFEYFGKVHSTIGSRLKAEQWRRLVIGMLSVWQTWEIYSEEFLQELRGIFNGIQPITAPNLAKEVVQSETLISIAKFKPLQTESKPIALTPQAAKKPQKIGFQLKKSVKVMPMLKNTFNPIDSTLIDLSTVVAEKEKVKQQEKVVVQERRQFEGLFEKSLIDIEIDIDKDLDGLPLEDQDDPSVAPSTIPHPGFIPPPPSVPHPSMVKKEFVPPPPSVPHPSM